MSVCLCFYVYVCIRVYVYMYICIYVYMYISIYPSMHLAASTFEMRYIIDWEFKFVIVYLLAASTPVASSLYPLDVSFYIICKVLKVFKVCEYSNVYMQAL